MKDIPTPLKLYYLDPVFSTQDPLQIEHFQAGIECIGVSDTKTDASIIQICIESLLKMGFEDIMIDIGHTDFAKDLPDNQKKALLQGDYISYGDLPERGSIELVKDFPRLQEIYGHLKDANLEKYISFNKGLVKDYQYYTGLIFECSVKGAKHIIASGGRYNHLLEKFGYDCPAVGFAFNLSRLQKVIS